MDVDAALNRLRELPVDTRLARMDGVVLEAIASSRFAGTPLSGAMISIAAGVALAIGLAGSIMSPYPESAPSIAPFGAPATLAPSSLLGTEG